MTPTTTPCNKLHCIWRHGDLLGSGLSPLFYLYTPDIDLPPVKRVRDSAVNRST